MSYDKIIDKLKLDESDKQFIRDARSDITGARAPIMNFISAVYLTQKIDTTMSKLIASNETLAKSNEKHSRAMIWLTVAIVLIGVMQILLSAVGYLLKDGSSLIQFIMETL